MHNGLQLSTMNTCMTGDLYQIVAHNGKTAQANQLSNQHPQESKGALLGLLSITQIDMELCTMSYIIISNTNLGFILLLGHLLESHTPRPPPYTSGYIPLSALVHLLGHQ